MDNNSDNNENDIIDNLKNYLLEIGFSKEKLDSFKFITEKFLNNLIINEIKKKDKIFRQNFFNKKKKNNTKDKYLNLIDLINDN